jgi:DNA-binding PadR family transcriptional regulator
MPPPITDHLPLKPVDLEILLALAGDDLHGYGLVQAVTAHTDGLVTLDPGNLYRVIKRLLETGLVPKPARRPRRMRAANDASTTRSHRLAVRCFQPNSIASAAW